MKTKKIVKLTIGYTDEFTFDDIGDVMFFLQLWNKGKVDKIFRATIEIVEVPIAIEDPAQDPVYSEPVPTKGVDC